MTRKCSRGEIMEDLCEGGLCPLTVLVEYCGPCCGVWAEWCIGPGTDIVICSLLPACFSLDSRYAVTVIQ